MTDTTQHLIEQARNVGLTWSTAPADKVRRGRWEDRLRALLRKRRRNPLTESAAHFIAARLYMKAGAYTHAFFEVAQAMAGMALPMPCTCSACTGEVTK